MKVGVVGVGYWGSKVFQEYRALRGNKIDKVFSCDVKNSLSPNFTEFGDMLPYIDAVHICTNNTSHFEIAKIALQKGKHVMLEKPMTSFSKDDIDLLELSRQKKLNLQVGFVWLHSNIIQKVKGLIENDYFGRLYALKLRWSNLQEPIKDTDIVWDLLPHPLSILLYLLGKQPNKIVKISNSFRRKQLDEISFIGFKFPLGTLASVELSWLQNPKIRSMEIIGSSKSSVIDLNTQTLDGEQIPVNNTILSEVSYFIDCCNGQKDTLQTGRMGAEITELIEEVMKV